MCVFIVVSASRAANLGWRRGASGDRSLNGGGIDQSRGDIVARSACRAGVVTCVVMVLGARLASTMHAMPDVADGHRSSSQQGGLRLFNTSRLFPVLILRTPAPTTINQLKFSATTRRSPFDNNHGGADRTHLFGGNCGGGGL